MSTSWLNQIGGILDRYRGNQAAPPAQEVGQHYDQVAQSVPRDALSSALASSFRSDQTPAFSQLISQAFSQSNSDQKAGILNTLLSSGAGTGLSDLLQRFGLGNKTQVAPADAEKLSPQQVQEIATTAEHHDPSIVDRAGQFYAQHPTLVKVLGAVVMSTALSHLMNRQR